MQDTFMTHELSVAHSFINLSLSMYDFCQGLYSLSGKMSYRQISRSLEAARFDVTIIVSLWKVTGIKFQSDRKSLNPNLVASRLQEILR